MNERVDPPSTETETETGTDPTTTSGVSTGETLLGGGDAEGGKTSEGEPEGEAEAPEPFDPEKFEWPENITTTEDQRRELGELAQKHGISGEAMKDLVGMYAGLAESALKDISTQLDQQWDQKMTEWRTATEELYGAKMDTVVASCNKVLTEFGSPELKQLLDSTGMGNHPEMFKFVTKVAEAIGEAKPVSTGASAEDGPTVLDAMYPTMKKA